MITAASVGVFMAHRVERDWLAFSENALRAHAILLQGTALEALEGNVPDTQARIRSAGERAGVRITIIDGDGEVIGDSEEDPARMDNHLDRPEVMSARSHGIGMSTRFSNTLAVNMMYAAVPVERNGVRLGYVRAAFPLAHVDATLDRMLGPIIAGATVAAIVALALGFFVVWRLTRPLSTLAETIRSATAGDHPRVAVDARDEVGAIAKSFNAMSEELEDNIQTILTDRNKLIAILSSMVEGVLAVDRDDRIVHINDVAARVLGLDPDRVLGRRVWEVTRRREIDDVLRLVIADGREITREFRLARDSRNDVFEIRASALRDGSGAVTGAVMVLHDVSELRRLERVRQEFVANASHELKTPITAVRGLVETLLDDETIDPPKRRDFLERIRLQSNRLSALITDLLALSRIESRDTPPSPARIELRQVLRDSAQLRAPAAKQKSIDIRLDVPDREIFIDGDREAIQELVENLLDNAIKYTPEAGRVTLRVSAQAESARIDVEDTGIGIDPADQPRVFERFYRVDKGRSRELGGTGLGLSIVKHVALLHRGDVAVESRPGHGSTFRVRLPLAAGPVPSA